jgi:glycylpeptide N-tetradecanoyltransferase
VCSKNAIFKITQYNINHMNQHKFWNNQPIIQSKEYIIKEEEIKQLEKNDVPKKLISGFEWVICDISEKLLLKELNEFLNYYYYEQFGKKIKHHFTEEFISWTFKGPRYHKDLLLGIRSTADNLLIGFIGATIINMQINKNNFDAIQPIFICIHPKFRNKRLSPVMISELSRRAANLGYNKGVFTTNKSLSCAISKMDYYQRPINVDILNETGIIKIDKSINFDEVKKSYYLSSKPSNKLFVPLNEKYIDDAQELLNNYLQKYNIYQIFSREEFVHIFFDNIFVKSYVLLDDDGITIDFVSYYKTTLRTSTDPIKYISKATLYYYTCFDETAYRLANDIMICSKLDNVDLFCAYDVLENKDMLKELKFDQSNQHNNLCLYNWRCRPLQITQVGLMPLLM